MEDKTGNAGKKKAQKFIKSMESKRKQTRKEAEKKRLIFCAAALVVLVILILILCKACGKKDDPVITEDPVATGTAEVVSEATPVPNATPAPTAQPAIYLDIVKRGPTNQKIIAITVDDIKSVDNLLAIMNVCESNKCAVTLFPTGKAVSSSADLQAALRRAYQIKCEIGNYGYENKNLYSLTDEEMAAEIFDQNKAVSKALGFNYTMHVLRTHAEKGENDLRTHQYLVQLGGYKAIAGFGYDAEDHKLTDLKKSLKNGYIYRFDTSDDCTKKLSEFIPYAVSQGYQIVTLSAMMGYGENEVAVLEETDAPTPYPFVYSEYVVLGSKTMQCYAVQLLQKRLIELGYLPADSVADGDYGKNTKKAIQLFQNMNNLDVDGIAGAGTQQLLFSDEAIPYQSTDLSGAV